MSVIIGEIAALLGATVTGIYIAWSVLERGAHIVTDRHLTPFASYSSLGAALLLVPVFVALRRKHHYLNGTRVNGCKPGKVYPHWDPILGLDLFLISVKALKECRLQKKWDELINRFHGTYWCNIQGQWVVTTAEPENFKAMLASHFDDWPILSVRQQASVLTIGPHSIFSVNGPEWQHARGMIRPCFVRNQLADLECTDRHVENFLSKLPRDGTKFDIDQLFYFFTMDVATDFM